MVKFNKPNIVIWNTTEQTAQLIDVKVPQNYNVVIATANKITKYKDLQIEIQNSGTWKRYYCVGCDWWTWVFMWQPYKSLDCYLQFCLRKYFTEDWIIGHNTIFTELPILNSSTDIKTFNMMDLAFNFLST